MSSDTTAKHESEARDYLGHDRGALSWLFSLDHKRIAVMYLVAILVAFLLAGLFALLVRIELLAPGRTMMVADAFDRLVTINGAMMVLLVALPGIPAVIGNFVLPLQLGAKDVAFPRLNLASFHLWLGGATYLILSMAVDPLNPGWTFTTPYSGAATSAAIPAAFAASILALSALLAALNFIVTVHKLRAPGMNWLRMPLLVWSLYGTAVIQLVTAPVLIATLLLLVVERWYAIPIFDPAVGGNPLLFQHFLWFYLQPAIFMTLIPAFGVVSEIIPTFSRKPIFGYRAMVLLGTAMTVLGFVSWGAHIFASGQSYLVSSVFSALAILIAVPASSIVFHWLATMYRGRIHLDAPMLYALAFIAVLTVGGLSGLFLVVLSVGNHLHHTAFAEAHFHYVMMATTGTALLGALHYWWPKMFGRMYHELGAKLGALLVFVGINLALFPQLLLGARGMPLNDYNYLPEFQSLQQLSTVGAFILALGVLTAGTVLLVSLRRPRGSAAANPWGANTLEWALPSPPPFENVSVDPTLPRGPEGDPCRYDHLSYDPTIGGYVKVSDAG